MSDIISSPKAGEGGGSVEFCIATVDNYNSTTGTTLIFPGSSTPSTKRYHRVGSGSLSAGQRALCIKISGTWLIIGRIY